MNGSAYAGDVNSKEAYAMLEREPQAVLVDVRTTPEWQFVGVPDLSALGKAPLFLSWQEYPEMRVAESFAEQLLALGIGPKQPVLLLCRSGARSRAAALALTAAGFTAAYNVADGFEGPLDEERHRGIREGWKSAGLPWAQQ